MALTRVKQARKTSFRTIIIKRLSLTSLKQKTGGSLCSGVSYRQKLERGRGKLVNVFRPSVFANWPLSKLGFCCPVDLELWTLSFLMMICKGIMALRS